MEKKVILIFCLCSIFLGSKTLKAQNYLEQDKFWTIGFGFNIVYDSGEQFGGLFDIKDNYHYRTPLRASLERRLSLKYGIEGAISYNKFLRNKVLNTVILDDDIDFLSIDTTFKYYFSNSFFNGHRSAFEGFIVGGISQNFYDFDWSLSINTGLGLNFFLTDTVSLTGQTLLKFTLVEPSPIQGRPINDFIHYNIGIVLKLPKKI